MFVTNGQFFVFLACFAFGGISGILFSLFNILKAIIKCNFIRDIIDFFVFVIIALLFVLYQKRMFFPNLRIYMFVGVFLGMICYFKSFNFTLANFVKKIYNNIVINKRRKKNGRTKTQKST